MTCSIMGIRAEGLELRSLMVLLIGAFRAYLKDQKTLKSKGPMPWYYESLYGL